MSKTASLFEGPITLEYGEIANNGAFARSTTNTCGDGCTAHPHPKGAADSCPIPGEKKEKDKDKDKHKHKAFAPVVAGWSEPPAARL